MLTIFVNIQLFQELVWQGETLFYWCGKACVFWTVIQSNKLAAVMYCVKWHPDIVAYWPVEHQILTDLKVSTFSSHNNIIPFLLTSYWHNYSLLVCCYRVLNQINQRSNTEVLWFLWETIWNFKGRYGNLKSQHF